MKHETIRKLLAPGFAILALASCSTAQKISIRQEQSGQVQETVIEQSGHLESLSLSFYLFAPAD
ncbi:MAG: hypothetical protein ACI4BD_01235 [Paludibacteraceae bacterium]